MFCLIYVPSSLFLSLKIQMSKTSIQYTKVINDCKDIFAKKTKDYGMAWRILRPSSLTDQIFIKAKRIRTVQITGENKVGESVEGDFKAIVNYCVMALIQLLETDLKEMELDEKETLQFFEKYTDQARELMEKKNHDYGEAWRDMRISSLTDLILMKLLRIKQIENNAGATLISEGIDANYFDMLNYSVFALIHIENE